MLRYVWIVLIASGWVVGSVESWALCYYLVDQQGNVQSSIYPPYDLSYPSEQLSSSERARRAQYGHLIIGASSPTCSRQPFSPPKIASPQPLDAQNKTDNTPTQARPRLQRPLTAAELQEAAKTLQQPEPKQLTTRPQPPMKPEVSPAKTHLTGTQPSPVSAPYDKPAQKIEKVEKTNKAKSSTTATQGEESPFIATKEPAKETVQPKPEQLPQPNDKVTDKQPIQLTENMVLEVIQAIDDSLTTRNIAAYRKLLAPSLEIGELKGGGKLKTQKLTAKAYSKQLEQALAKIARYELKHVNPKITIDPQQTQATVNSNVQVRLEFQDALETSKTYGEITTFNLVDDKLLLSRLVVVSNAPKLTEQPVSTQTTQAVDPCKGITDIPHTECQSLVELYQTTNGDKWKNKKNWFKTKQPCQWFGVTCVNNHVVTLKLDKNQLQGNLPNLGGLTALKVLNLSRNNLTGALPSFHALLELEVLSLSNNNLSGRLPDLSHLKLLRILELNKNQLTGDLPFFDNFPELEEVNLSDNQFVGEIPSLKKMNKLQKLALYNNQLTGSLPSLDQLVSLKSMHLSGNHLSGQIPELTNLLQLESLNLSVNQLSGTLPVGLSKLVNLKWLQLESNQLSGKIPDLRNLQKLTILKLQNNQLCGEIPEGLRLSGLKHPDAELQIENNHLTATHPGLLNFLETKIPQWQTTQKPKDNCD